MEQIIKPISDIAYLNTGLLLLAESDQKVKAQITYSNLEAIQGMAFHLGGEFKIHRTVLFNDRVHCFGFFRVAVKNLELTATFEMSEIAYSNQLAAFSNDTFICQKGTQLTIIDDSYFVF